MLCLKEANWADARAEYEFIANCPPEEGFGNRNYGVSWERFEQEVLPRMLDSARGIGLPPGAVGQISFFLWDGEAVVGLFRLRPRLPEEWRERAGHIGYVIRPEYRGRGYATRGLALAMEKAWALIPEQELWFTVHRDNPASRRVLEKNGASLHHSDAKFDYLCAKREEI